MKGCVCLTQWMANLAKCRLCLTPVMAHLAMRRLCLTRTRAIEEKRGIGYATMDLTVVEWPRCLTGAL